MKKIALSLFVFGVASISAPVLAAQPSVLKGDRIKIDYVQPTNPEHQAIYELVKERQALERFRDYLRPMRLPGPLLLRIAGCDGDSNAWYEESDHSVTVCYEYLADIQANVPKETTPAGVTPEDALIGPTIEVFLHEIGHAVFSMLKVPVLGREEDAADQIAAYFLLQLGKEGARKTVVGVAYMYGHEMQSKSPGLKQFADVHGLPAQRFYNLLCMAYGADAESFGDMVQAGYLPESRAEWCHDEYKQVDYAVHKLIAPYVDQKLLKSDPTRKKKLLKQADQP